MPGAISAIPGFYVTEFEQNWLQLVQQTESYLAGHVTMQTVSGKNKKFPQIGIQEMQNKVGRAAVTQVQDVPMAARWLSPTPSEIANRFDEYDDEFLGEVVLPTSGVMTSQVSAYHRRQDKTIIDALDGTNYIGDTGVTPVTLPASQEVAVNYTGGTPANTGLTLAKVIKAASILSKNEVPQGNRVLLVSQKQIDDFLLNVDQVDNSRYADVKALMEGQIFYFMGFTWVRSEQLPLVVATDIRSCFAFHKSGVFFAENGRKAYMDILPTFSHALQIRTTANMGATREDEKKVVRIFCDESP